MKRRLITLLMVVAMLASVAMVASASKLPEEATDLGQMTWSNGDTQQGWRGVTNAAREYGDDPLFDADNEITLTEGQIFKATHLVLELAAAPEGDLQIIWQSDYDAWGWNQSQIPLDDLLLMMDGNTLTIPLPYYVANYPTFISIALQPEPPTAGNFEGDGGALGILLNDDEIAWEGKFLLGYYNDNIESLGVQSAQLTYGPVGAPANKSLTYDLGAPRESGTTDNGTYVTLYAQASGDGVVGNTLLKSILTSAMGITLVVDAAGFEDGTEVGMILQSMDYWWQDMDGAGIYYTYSEDGDLGYLDIYLSSHSDWDTFCADGNLHGKFGFTNVGEDNSAFISAYLWWEAPVRGEVDTGDTGDDGEGDTGDDGEDGTGGTTDEGGTGDTTETTTTTTTSDDSEGLDTWVWILIAVGAVAIIVIIIVVVKGKKK